MELKPSKMMRYLVLGFLCLAMVLADSETTEKSNRVVRQSGQPMTDSQFPQQIQDMAAKAGEAFSTAVQGFKDGMERIASGINGEMRTRREINEQVPSDMKGPPEYPKQPPSVPS